MHSISLVGTASVRRQRHRPAHRRRRASRSTSFSGRRRRHDLRRLDGELHRDVEKHNPAATATGLAIWGWILRIVVSAFFALLPVAVHSTTTLVDKGHRVEQIVAAHPDQVKVLKTVDASVLAALDKHPNDPRLQARALSQLSALPIPAVSSIVTHGDRVKHAGNRLGSLSKVPAKDLSYLEAHGSRVNRILASYPRQIAVLRRLDSTNAAKLNANPGDTAAQAEALSQLSGLPVATVTAAMSYGSTIQAAADR